MKIEDAGELIFQTYYMVDWKTIPQAATDRNCVNCGGDMIVVGPVQDKKGLVYEGFVCHGCKSIFWLKRD